MGKSAGVFGVCVLQSERQPDESARNAFLERAKRERERLET
jgi:hypothetical protein